MATFDDGAVRTLVAAEAAAPEDKPALAGWLQRMCRVAARHVPASGVGLSLVNGPGVVVTAAASDSTSVLVEELQFTLGEGPCLMASSSGRPVHVPDLTVMSTTTWPTYAPAAHDHGVRAVFAFPLMVGVASLGALDVYRRATGELSAASLDRALTFAEVATETLLGPPDHADGDTGWLDDLAEDNYLVYQAQGMVMIQLGVSAEEALVRLRAYAYAHDRRLSAVAHEVVRRRLRFEEDQG